MTHQEFKNIFNDNFDPIRRYLYYRCGNTDLATDLAQDTFLRLWEKRDSLNGEPVKGLLYKMASDLFISRYRKNKVRQEFIIKRHQPQLVESPQEQLQYKEMQQRYQSALGSLPEKQRVVFLMSRMEELKYQEIAHRLNLSVKAVEKRMKNALSAMRKIIER